MTNLTPRQALARRKLLTRLANNLTINGIYDPATAILSDLTKLRGIGPASIGLIMDVAANPDHEDRNTLFPLQGRFDLPADEYDESGHGEFVRRIEVARHEPTIFPTILVERALSIAERSLAMLDGVLRGAFEDQTGGHADDCPVSVEDILASGIPARTAYARDGC